MTVWLRRRVRESPLAFVAGIAVAAAALRYGVAIQVRTPIVYPDEYLYTALSRGIGGGRFAKVLAGHVGVRQTTAYLGPILMAPFWRLSNVIVAYRLSQALGVVCFAAAAFPAFVLGRRLGISAEGSVAVSLLAVATPCGIFTSMLLSESYVYPLFLLAVAVAVEAIAAPTLARLAAALAIGLGLCFAGGMQFLFFAPCFLATLLVGRASSLRSRLLRSAIVLVAALCAVRYIETRNLVELHYGRELLAGWFVANAFVFAIGAGWIIVPGAILGLRELGRDRDPRRRAFALLSAFAIVAMLLEAAVWGASGQGTYERFTFYGSPLLALACIWAIESQALVRRRVAAVAYLLAASAALLPTLAPLRGAIDDHSPTLKALGILPMNDRSTAIVWAPILVALALCTAWRAVGRGQSTIIVATTICLALSGGASIAYLRLQSGTRIPEVRASKGTTLVTWANGNEFFLMKTLFWNPSITRVVVLGPGQAPLGFGFEAASIGPRRTLLTAGGVRVDGPFLFAPDSSTIDPEGTAAGSGFVTLRSMPAIVAFGWSSQPGYLGTFVRIFAAPGGIESPVTIRLSSPNLGRKVIAVRCDGGFETTVNVGLRAVSTVVPIFRGTRRTCSFRIIRGAPDSQGGLDVSVRAVFTLRPGKR